MKLSEIIDIEIEKILSDTHANEANESSSTMSFDLIYGNVSKNEKNLMIRADEYVDYVLSKNLSVTDVTIALTPLLNKGNDYMKKYIKNAILVYTEKKKLDANIEYNSEDYNKTLDF